MRASGPDPDDLPGDSSPAGRRGDDQPSIQVAMAAALLRRGGTPARVARVTAVPLAMVQLLAEEIARDPTAPLEQAPSPPARAGCVGAAPRPPSWSPWWVPAWVSVIAGVSLLLDVGVAVAAMMGHVTVLGLVALLAAAPLLTLLIVTTIAQREIRTATTILGWHHPRTEEGDSGDGGR